MVDRGMVARLLSEIEDNLELLDDVKDTPQAELFRDVLRGYGVQHALQISIEALVAISHHLISECGFSAPEKHADAMSVLGRQGVISDPGLVQRLPSMVRFRNLLVHRYWEVDNDIVYEVLQTHLQDLRDFVVHVGVFLRDHPDY